MKLLNTFSLVVLSLSLFIACSKNSDVPYTAETMQGKWIGNYGFDNDAPTHFFSIQIKPGGVIQELNSSGVAKGAGTWKLEGNTIKGTWKMLFAPYNEYSLSVSVNGNGQMVGTWGYDKDPADGGKVLMSKANYAALTNSSP